MLWPSEVLPTPGGPTKHRIGLLPCRVELAHREVLENAPLDLVQAVVVVVEDAPRLGDVDGVRRSGTSRAARSATRDRCAPSSTRGEASGMRSRRLQLLAGLLLHFLGHAAPRRCACSSSAISAADFVVLAELLLDRAHLLAQQDLALALVDRLLRRSPISRDSFSTSMRLRRQRSSRVEALSHVEGLQHVLLLGRLDVHQAGDEVGEPRRRRDLACTAVASSAGTCGRSCRSSPARGLHLQACVPRLRCRWQSRPRRSRRARPGTVAVQEAGRCETAPRRDRRRDGRRRGR